MYMKLKMEDYPSISDNTVVIGFLSRSLSCASHRGVRSNSLLACRGMPVSARVTCKNKK